MSLATAPSLPPYSSLEHGCDDQSDCLATSSDFERPQVKWKVKGAWIFGDPGSRRSSSRRPPAHLSSNEKNKLRLLELVSCLWQMKAFLTHSPAVVRATEHIWDCVLENGNNINISGDICWSAKDKIKNTWSFYLRSFSSLQASQSSRLHMTFPILFPHFSNCLLLIVFKNLYDRTKIFCTW